jgi:hypothetical protein
MNDEPTDNGAEGLASGKKPYKTPKLDLYGSLSDLVRNVGPKGNLDGGGGSAAGPKTAQ